jgi:hypothetical protein
MRRYFLGLLLVVGLLILLIVLIVGGGSKAKVPTSSRTLDSYASSNATVSMEIDGPINAQSEHNQVLMTISNSSATIEALNGYNGSVASSMTYTNSEASYDAFLHALEYAGFTEGTAGSSLSNDSGYCPTGDRYIFELQQNGSTLERYWTTNCSGTLHTFEGDTGLISTLFQAQIPDYATMVQDLDL